MGDAVAPIRSVAALHMPAWVEMQPYNRDLGCLHSQVMAARSLSNPLCCLSLEFLDNRQAYNDNLYTAGLLKTTFLCTLTLVGKDVSCCVAYPDKREHGTRTSERRRNRKKQHRKKDRKKGRKKGRKRERKKVRKTEMKKEKGRKKERKKGRNRLSKKGRKDGWMEGKKTGKKEERKEDRKRRH